MRATLVFLACMILSACELPLFGGDEQDVRLEDVGTRNIEKLLVRHAGKFLRDEGRGTPPAPMAPS